MTAAQAASSLRQRDTLRVSGRTVVWLESDPPSGTTRLWTLRANRAVCVSPPELNIRSTVNSYGGGALCLRSACAYVTDSQTRQIFALECDTGRCRRLTAQRNSLFGGLVDDPSRERLLAVRELEHTDGAKTQQLVAISTRNGAVSVLTAGEDFYGAPALSEDGSHMAWITWSLPDMPWLRTRLWLAAVDGDGQLQAPRECAAPVAAAIQQPVFAHGNLWAVSDHLGWWQPYRLDLDQTVPRWHQVPCEQLDYANAPWQLAEHHQVPLDEGGWARVCFRNGLGELWITRAQATIRLAEEYTDFRALQVQGDTVICIGRRADALDSILAIEPRAGSVRVLAGGEQPLAAGTCVRPDTFDFRANDGRTVGGFLYSPVSAKAETAQAPPLIVLVHGGPSSAAYATFDPQIQFWCQHGFAVATVNHRGSTGAGRDFRLALAGRWGEIDVDDVCQAADVLAERGLARRDRLFIQGRSAGGFTVLLALMRGSVFRAGASLFGVSDPARLRAITHRFESGYLDWLLGDPQAHTQRWQERTPVNHADRIRQPVIFFQGGKDPIVVPHQTESMVAALEAAGRQPEYHFFADEGHGFRRADNQVRLLERLLAFYQRQV